MLTYIWNVHVFYSSGPLGDTCRSNAALHVQAWTLLLLGPFLDRYISHAWVFNYDWNVPALTFLTLSCACAVGVNVLPVHVPRPLLGRLLPGPLPTEKCGSVLAASD